MGLDDERLDELISLINDSFRIHENQDPIYVDIGGHLDRIGANQHQVVFGRRGSGKSCLLVHYLRRIPPTKSTLAIYMNADEVKRLTYPDLLIRLLLSVLGGVPEAKRRLIDRLRRTPGPVSAQTQELRALLGEAETAKVTKQRSGRRARSLEASAKVAKGSLSGQRLAEQAEAETAEFMQDKKDYLERHLQDIKDVLQSAIASSGSKRAIVMVDDFYLIHHDVQPDVVDYLHRLLRGTDLYLKVATVRHRSRLARHVGRLIGVELGQDVEAINLDQTFEDLEATKAYLAEMLNSLGKKAGIVSATDEFLSPDGLFALTLASGGVPRDYLTIFNEAVAAARAEKRASWVTPRYVYRGAARVSYRTKLSNLRSDAGPDAANLERVFTDLLTFTLKDKRKTAFLIEQEEAARRGWEHEMVQQLMDFKLIHVIVPDTSAASGRPGRYEAYTLDAASFMEPRPRFIEIVEFWKTDDQRRPLGVREAPIYPLDRVIAALEQPVSEPTENVIAELDAETAATSAEDSGNE